MMWETVKLGEILEVQNGYAFESKKFSHSSGMPLIRIRDLKKGMNTEIRYEGEFEKKYIVRSKDLLIGMDGEFRCYEWNGDDALLNQRVCRLKIIKTESILPKFIFYTLNNKLKEIEDVTSFITVKHISSKEILNIDFLLPPIAEQQIILAKLDNSFFEINKLINLNKEALRQKQKLEENFYKDFFKSLEDEYGMMKLEEGIQLISGQHIMSKDYNSNRDGIGYLTGPADFGSVSPVVSKFTLKPKKTAIKNDILITLKGSGIGKVNIMNQNELAISRQLAAIRPTKFDPSFLFIFLKTKFNYFQKLGNGAAIPGLSRVDVQTLEVPKVPIAKQHVVLEKLQQFQLLISRYETLQNLKYKELKSLKSSILSKEIKN